MKNPEDNFTHITNHNATKYKIIFWLVSVTLFFTFLYLIKSILLPFVIGIMAAFFLDPAADKLEKLGLSRNNATAAIIVGFFMLISLAAAALVPVIYHQAINLLDAAPEYVTQLQEHYKPIFEHFISRFGDHNIETVRQSASNVSAPLTSFGGSLLKGILTSSSNFINLLSLLLITPVVAFYLLRDWDKITAYIDGLLPRKHAQTIKEQMNIIHLTLAGFIRGQSLVCIILAGFYALALSLADMPFSVLLGIAAGLLIIIPYAGSFMATAISLLVAWVHAAGDLNFVAIIGAIFGVGMVLEGYILTPNLVGKRVGLHPVWLIFGMMAGGALFGFTGILIAVPVTAICGVLTRFAITQYLQSSFY